VELMEHFGRRDGTRLRNQFLRPLLEADWLAMTMPDKPTSSK